MEADIWFSRKSPPHFLFTRFFQFFMWKTEVHFSLPRSFPCAQFFALHTSSFVNRFSWQQTEWSRWCSYLNILHYLVRQFNSEFVSLPFFALSTSSRFIRTSTHIINKRGISLRTVFLWSTNLRIHLMFIALYISEYITVYIYEDLPF